MRRDTSSGRFGTAWRVGLLAAVTAVAVVAHVWYRNRHQYFDLLIYRDAVRWWVDGHPLYEFARPDLTQGQLSFTYPPFAAMLFLPFAWLTPAQTIAVYTVVAGAAFAASVWWITRPLADRLGQPAWFVAGLAFVLGTGLEPIREAYTFGQINFVLWALILLDLLVLLARGSRLTGIGIGVATAIKLVPGIFIAYLLVCRRWRPAGLAVGTAAGAALVGAAVAPRDSWTYWTSTVLHGEGVGHLDYTFNQSVMGVLARLGTPSPVLWALLVVPLLGYALWRARRAADAGDELCGLCLVGMVGSLASPVTWQHHLFWFVPALVILIDTLTRPAGERAGRRRWALIGLALLDYVTVTVSVLSLWEYWLGRPAGVAVIMSNWCVWLMLLLLPTLPIRSATHSARRDVMRAGSLAPQRRVAV